MNTPRKRSAGRLGKGLSSLMATPVAVPSAPDASTQGASAGAPLTPVEGVERDRSTAAPEVPRGTLGDQVRQLRLDELHPNPLQPRRSFDGPALEGLAASIRAEGLIQPVSVRPRPAGGFEIIAGERRWRAAAIAELSTLPALVRPLSDADTARWALIENLQREDLNPIERADALQHLCDTQNLRHAEVGDAVGLSRSSVTNLLRLLTLAPAVRALVADGLLRMGHARALVALEDAPAQVALAERSVREGWSVRTLEGAVRKHGQSKPGTATSEGPPPPLVRAAWLRDLEAQLTAGLEAPVRVAPGRKKGTGTVTLEYRSLEDFDRLLQRLGVQTG